MTSKTIINRFTLRLVDLLAQVAAHRPSAGVIRQFIRLGSG